MREKRVTWKSGMHVKIFEDEKDVKKFISFSLITVQNLFAVSHAMCTH